MRDSIRNAELVRVILDGKSIQCREGDNDDWYRISGTDAIRALISPANAGYQFEVAPEPAVRYLALFADAGGGVDFSLWLDPKGAEVIAATRGEKGALYKIEVDPNTLNAELVKMGQWPEVQS